MFQAVIEAATEGEAPKGAWERHVDQALVEIIAKGEALKATRKSHRVEALVEFDAKPETLKAIWSVTLARLWLKYQPKVRLRRPLGNVTSSSN